MMDLLLALWGFITIPVRFVLWPLTVWFDTWLGFLGIVVGLALAAYYGWKPLRTAIAGYACGVLVVVIVNGLGAQAAPCLEKARGLDIFRAYSYECAAPPVATPPAATKK